MNPTIHLLTHRFSNRSFTEQAVDEQDLEAIIASAQQAPTSLNSQQVSLVVTRSKAQREQIAAYAGNQPWVAKAPIFITLVLDLHKTEAALQYQGKQQIAHETIEGLISGCTDVGIALSTIMTAAQALGLGTVAIGGIRQNLSAMIDLLKLPKHTFPVVGVAIGHIDTPAAVKPRLARHTFQHDEYYHLDGFDQAIQDYDDRLTQYWQRINRPDGQAWSKNIAGLYSINYCPDDYNNLLKQGFTFDK